MSATIYWEEPLKKKHLKGTMAPSRFISSMESTFGPFPLRIGDKDVKTLHGMASVWGEKIETNPYLQLIDLLADREVIELTVEY